VGRIAIHNPPQYPLAHPRVEYSDNGVADAIALLVGFSEDQIPKSI
jgi:hypothetical protein